MVKTWMRPCDSATVTDTPDWKLIVKFDMEIPSLFLRIMVSRFMSFALKITFMSDFKEGVATEDTLDLVFLYDRLSDSNMGLSEVIDQCSPCEMGFTVWGFNIERSAVARCVAVG